MRAIFPFLAQERANPEKPSFLKDLGYSPFTQGNCD